MLDLVPVPGVVMPFTLNVRWLKDINSWVLCVFNSLVHWVGRFGASLMSWVSLNSQLCKTQWVLLGWAQLDCQHLVYLRCAEVLETLQRVASYYTGPTWHPHSTGEFIGVPGGQLGESQWLRMLVYWNWAETLRSDSTQERDPQLSTQRLH